MARFAIVQNFIRAVRRGINLSDTQCDPGGGANVKAYHAQQPGDDSHPLPDDTAVLVDLPRSNGFAAVGYIDPKNTQTAQPGARRMYSRDADGNQVAEVHLHNDGQIRASNAAGFVDLGAGGIIEANSGGAILELQPGGQGEIRNGAGFIRLLADGSVSINGFVISPTGQATDADGIGVHSHTHTQPNDGAGNQQQRTDAASNP